MRDPLHPTGVLTPSAADIDLTARLAIAGKILEVPLLDHFILGQHTDHVSLHDQRPELFMATNEEPGGSDAAG